MPQKAPGRCYRAGMSVRDLARMFPSNRAAERFFIRKRWPNGVACHHCGSTNVQTGRGEYVRGDVHVNGVEGFWAAFKRGYVGSYFRMSPEHLQRYVNEFAGRTAT